MAGGISTNERNVWVEFIELTVANRALNFGQGFPDFLPPSHTRKALIDAASSDDPKSQQYTRPYGHIRLVKALSDVYSPYLGKTIDFNTEILVTIGAYGALYNATQGLINPGDEVIIIEPFFDCYETMVRMAGGIPVFVPLRPISTDGDMSSADWILDEEELTSKFSEKTKAIFFNSPNNPLGKVHTLEEMQYIANLCIKHNVFVISDEVYEWLVFPPKKHIKTASLPGMWDRTITIGSGGKTFSVTGWKLGWAIGPDHLLKHLKVIHHSCCNSLATPLQEALARGFEQELERLTSPDCYFNQLPAELVPKRDRLARLLSKIGMKPIIPEGGYFMIADFSNLYTKEIQENDNTSDPKDYKFVRWMIKFKKLAGIPPSAFYGPDHKELAQNYIRFCFIKDDSTMDKLEQLISLWQ